MAILRKNNKQRYTTFLHDITLDENLSLKDFGLLIKLLSLPDDWEFSEKGLEKIFKKDGQTSIRTALKNLEKYGYLQRTRKRDENGRVIGIEWYVYEESQGIDFTENPHFENHSLVNHSLEIPSCVNHKQYNIKESNTKKSKIKESNIKREEPPRKTFGEYKNVYLSDNEYNQLKEEFSDGECESIIERISEYQERMGKQYKNHFLTIRKWGKEDREKASFGSVKNTSYNFDTMLTIDDIFMGS